MEKMSKSPLEAAHTNSLYARDYFSSTHGRPMYMNKLEWHSQSPTPPRRYSVQEPIGYYSRIGASSSNYPSNFTTSSPTKTPIHTSGVKTSVENVNFTLRTILLENKLTQTNFLDWDRNLRIILEFEAQENVLEKSVPTLTSTSSEEEKHVYKLAYDRSRNVTCLMLVAMEPDLQERFEDQDAYTMITNLRIMFKEQARLERYLILKAIMNCKLDKGKPVGPHVYNMIGLFDKMARLGNEFNLEMSTDMILNSLHDGFAYFCSMYHMNGMNKSLNELHVMLKTVEQNTMDHPTKDILMVKAKRFKKGPLKKHQNEGKGKQVAQNRTNTPKVKVAANHDCFYCNGKGHWKRNCHKYLEDKKKGNVSILGLKH